MSSRSVLQWRGVSEYPWVACVRGALTLALIYIQEAHAVDEWSIARARMSRVGLGPPTAEGAGGGCRGVKAAGAPVSIVQHKSLPERLAAARSFVADYGVPLRFP